MRTDPNPAASYIADHAKELAILAANNGHEALAYLLQMAEMEARSTTRSDLAETARAA